MEQTAVSVGEKIGSEGEAYAYLEGLRWHGKPVCPHCDAGRVYFLTPVDGVRRKTRTGAMSERRVWKCGACRRQFSVLAGTILHGTQVPILTWLSVVAEVCAAEDGVSGRDIEQRCTLNPWTASTMLRRIVAASNREPVDPARPRWPTMTERDEIIALSVDAEEPLRLLLTPRQTPD